MDLKKQKAILLLEDGRSFVGVSSGALGKVFGKVVFNTGMVGYQQLLTDPCNHDLLVMQTFPLIGNYGINATDFESNSPQVSGYIAREICDEPSNYKCVESLPTYLKRENVVAITGIDTREVTKHIREKGEMRGAICVCDNGECNEAELLEQIKQWQPSKLKKENSAAAIGVIGDPPICKVAFIDFGAAQSALVAVATNGAALNTFSSNVKADTIINGGFDGVILSNGGGNPNTDYEQEIETIKELVKNNIPILGIGLGHQLLALANGMTVTPLKCGHRGANQPVFSNENGRTYITTQNHGYVVDTNSVKNCENVKITYQNANDRTVEGLDYQNSTSVQFIPDSIPSKQSTSFIYTDFFEKINSIAKKGKVD